MGLDELSVNPGGILSLRKIIRETDLGENCLGETDLGGGKAAATPAEQEEKPAETPEPESFEQTKKKKFSLFGKGKK